MNFDALTAKNRTVVLPTLRNHHLLGIGAHHVGLSLGVHTFLVGNITVMSSLVIDYELD